MCVKCCPQKGSSSGSRYTFVCTVLIVQTAYMPCSNIPTQAMYTHHQSCLGVANQRCYQAKQVQSFMPAAASYTEIK